MPDKYWVGGTDTWNATAGTKWALTSGGAGGQPIPTTADNVFFDVLSGINTITTSTSSTCLAINFTGFIGTFNMAANWSAAGSVTFVNTMTLTGTATLTKVLNNAVSYICNGLTFTGSINIGLVSGTILYDDWTILGSWTSTATALGIGGTTGTKTITVGGSVSATSCSSGNNITFLMNGTGSLVGNFTATTINIAGTITQSGTITFNGSTFTFTSGSYVASNIRFGTGNTTFNNVSTLTFTTLQNFGGNPTITLNSDLSCSDISFVVTTTINSASNKLLITGSIGNNINLVGSGTATIEMTGSTPATIGNGTIQNNFIINKSGGANVTITGNLTLGANGRFLTMNTNTLFGSTLVGIVGTTFTINNASGSSFNDLTISTASSTITLNNQITVNGSLNLSGTTTFAGAYGFTCTNFSCTVANSAITLQNINANPLAQYVINGVLTLIGTLAQRITLQAADSAIFNGTITPVNQLNYISGTAPSIGMTVSQSTGISPTGLIGLLPNRPVITAGVSPTFTISPSATTTIGVSFAIRAGFKAIFTLTNGTGTQNVAYVTTQDIDSNNGQTILSFGSNADTTSVNTALFRTLNWASLVAPSSSSYFTFVN